MGYGPALGMREKARAECTCFSARCIIVRKVRPTYTPKRSLTGYTTYTEQGEYKLCGTTQSQSAWCRISLVFHGLRKLGLYAYDIKSIVKSIKGRWPYGNSATPRSFTGMYPTGSNDCAGGAITSRASAASPMAMSYSCCCAACSSCWTCCFSSVMNRNLC